MNTYTLDNEECTQCDDKELIYHQAGNFIKCQSCGTLFETNGEIINNE